MFVILAWLFCRSDRITSYTEGREGRNSFPYRQLNYPAKRRRVQLPQATRYMSQRLKPTVLLSQSMCVLLCQTVPPPTLLSWYLRHAENIQVEWPDRLLSLFYMSYLIEVDCVFLSGTHGELWRVVCNLWAVIKKCKLLTTCSRLSSLLNWEMSQLLSIRGRQCTWRALFRINFYSSWRGGGRKY